MNFKDAFINFKPTCEQEAVDQKMIVEFINRNSDCLERSNLAAHVTSSALITNKTFDKVLFAHHNIFDSWAWVGGHNDGNPDALQVALEEAKEETGIKNVIPYSESTFMIDAIYVPNHIKNGLYVNDHIHLNTTFLMIGDETDPLFVKEDENSGVRWFYITEVMDYITEGRIKTVYQKAFEHIERIRKTANKK